MHTCGENKRKIQKTKKLYEDNLFGRQWDTHQAVVDSMIMGATLLPFPRLLHLIA